MRNSSGDLPSELLDDSWHKVVQLVLVENLVVENETEGVVSSPDP
jgi:hypothetical protein